MKHTGPCRDNDLGQGETDHAGAEMAQEEFDELAETFEFLEDWEDRYRHVIDMGKAMPPLEEA